MNTEKGKQPEINRDYLKSYCASYTNNILDSAFKESPYLQGNDLKRLCYPDQINFNLLKAIFLQWEAEVNKFQNPYFDHSAPAVQNALKTYMEVLSRHIKLDKGSLRPLLQQAVEETLYQVFKPVYFFCNFLWPLETGALKLQELAKLKRFIRINKDFFDELIEQLQVDGKPEVELPEYRSKLLQLSSDWDRWEDTESYVPAFSKVVALNTKSLFNRSVNSSTDEVKEDSDNLNQRFAREIKSLNDTLQKKQPTLADQLNQKVERIDNIRSSLNINQKFRFINELYGGNSNEFNVVVDRLDRCHSYHEAMDTLDNHSSLRSEWNMDNEVVKELLSLVSKRFSEPGPAFGEHPSSTK